MNESERRQLFRGHLILAPMTKGSNLPFRRLCAELGARFSVGEMALSRRVTKRATGELALLRRHADEEVFNGYGVTQPKQCQFRNPARLQT